MASKEEIINALEKEIGNTSKGQEIIAKAKEVIGAPETKYHQDMVARLHESIAAYRNVIMRDDQNDKHGLAAADAEKLAIVEKALAIISQFKDEKE